MPANQYIIEELHSQDHLGVIFLATDVKKNSSVWLHRFFPQGDAEKGLEQDEIQQFQASISFMRFWSHRSLRKIFDGGCDPIDRIPFVVQESFSDHTLASLLATNYLSMEQGRQLAEQALVLIAEIENVLGGGAGWLSFDPEEIQVTEDGTKYRFAINPVRWIDKQHDPTTLKDLIHLVELAMGWSGRIVAGSTLGSLSGWVRLTRSKNLSCKDALALLRGDSITETPNNNATSFPSPEAITGRISNTEVFLPTGSDIELQPQVQLASLHKKSFVPWIIAGSLTLVVASTVVYLSIPGKNDKSPKSASSEVAKNTSGNNGQNINPNQTNVASTAPAKQSEKELSYEEKRRQELLNKFNEQKNQTPTRTSSAVPEKEYTPNQVSLISEQEGKTITMVGTVSDVREHNKKYRYLFFENPQGNEVLARHTIKGTYLMGLDTLTRDYKGKKIKVKGVVAKENTKSGIRYVVVINTRDDLEYVTKP